MAFPIRDLLKKPVTADLIVDRCHSKKDTPQFPGIYRLGGGPAPGQSLSLNVHKASLDDNFRPELAQYTVTVGLPSTVKLRRDSPLLIRHLKKASSCGNRAFRDQVLTGHNPVRISVHQSNESPWPVQECAIQDKMLALGQAKIGNWWRLFQTVVNQTIQLGWAMLALDGKLSDRISLNNPAPEPFALFGVSGRSIMPAKGLLAEGTKPVLFPIRIEAIPLENS